MAGTVLVKRVIQPAQVVAELVGDMEGLGVQPFQARAQLVGLPLGTPGHEANEQAHQADASSEQDQAKFCVCHSFTGQQLTRTA